MPDNQKQIAQLFTMIEELSLQIVEIREDNCGRDFAIKFLAALARNTKNYGPLVSQVTKGYESFARKPGCLLPPFFARRKFLENYWHRPEAALNLAGVLDPTQ